MACAYTAVADDVAPAGAARLAFGCLATAAAGINTSNGELP